MTLGRREVTDLLTAHGLRPSRALGQNFVVDPNTVRRIAKLAGVGPGDHVVEIGGGLGSLTLALAETGATVTSVEVDRYLAPVLRSVAEPHGVRVVEADAMRLDWEALLDGADRWSLVANLPYNVATPLLIDLLVGVPRIGRMVVMVQREVGERLAASPGDEQYGAVSAKVAYWASAQVVGRVPRGVFVPMPKVESALVALERRSEVPAVAYDRYAQVVELGFAQRRKMLRTRVRGLVDAACFEQAGVSPTQRAEELGVEAWCRLASCASWPPPS